MSLPESPLRLVVVGANHRSSSAALRDRLLVEDADMLPFLERLRGHGIGQALALATCDRVEVHAEAQDTESAARIIQRALAEHGGLEPSALSGQLYTLAEGAALRHLFAVASSLDSLVIGEPQVLGQLKAAHRMAREAGMTGPALEAALQAAYGAAKRVRSETAVAERPVSIAAAAVQLARDVHGDLSRASGLLIGGGDMGELVAAQMREHRLGNLVVTAPIASRAETLARQLDCHVAPFEELPHLLESGDVVITAVGSRRHAISAEVVQAALKRRRFRPILLIDTGIPGDVDPLVNRLDEAFLYDLNDLEKVAMEGRANREAAARAAWDIVDAEVAAFARGRAERAAVPALTALRRHFELVRAGVLADLGPDDADKATRLLINRLLHEPTEVLREVAAQGNDRPADDPAPGEISRLEALMRRLFRLKED